MDMVLAQYIIYRKDRKIPLDYRTGQPGNPHDPSLWLTRERAIEEAARQGAGIGFVLTENDPYFLLDLDHCLETEGEPRWSSFALGLVQAFSGAYVEVSSSGQGLHIIASGQMPEHSCKNAAKQIELYHTKRFIALTGTHATGSSALDCTPALDWLVSQYFKPGTDRVERGDNVPLWTEAPCAEWSGETDDSRLIERMLRSTSARSVFGGGVSFRDLWEGNTEALSRAYPDRTDKGRAYDYSSADAALAQRLAYYCGNDCSRMERLMRQSALRRDKWDDRTDYLPLTITGACGRQKEWLCESTQPPDSNAPACKPQAYTPFLDIEGQKILFKGCIYVQDEHKVMVPGGQLLTPDRFRTRYAGQSMPIDPANQRVTRNAWEAFTESQAFRPPLAETTCFRPDLEPGCLFQEEGQPVANLYHPVHIDMRAGDVTPFLIHMQKLFPNETDRMFVLCYMAAVIKHKGVKFQWCPLIQGVEGNGKTFLTRVVAYAVGRRYTHFPKASEIASRFNGWLYTRIFIAVEDAYLSDAKNEVMETLKPMITSEYQEVEEKGVPKVTRRICANFILNSNHKDGIRKRESDRRFAPFYTAQQEVEHLARDGMDSAYFAALYAWAENGGYAAIAHYLSTFDIPDDLNPARLLRRAPTTSSTAEAITHGMGRLEREVTEAIEMGRPGFKGGWISSVAYSKFLNEVSRQVINPKTRAEVLSNLGYMIHPSLNQERTSAAVSPDGCRVRLYIHKNSPHIHLDRHQIMEAYSLDQKE